MEAHEVLLSCCHCLAVCKEASRPSWSETEMTMAEINSVRLWNDCATICTAAIHFIGRDSTFAAEILELCSEVCDECSLLKSNKDAAKACKSCADACRAYASQWRRKAA